MYYITNKTSETGKKFAEVNKQMDEAWEKVVSFSKSIGIVEFRMDWCAVYGGLSAAFLPEDYDKKGWKELRKGEFMPDRRTKLGKLLQNDIDNLPRVDRFALNDCIGWKECFNVIGFHWKSDIYFGFITREVWNINIPEDCTEITSGEYKRTFTTSK